MANTTRISIYTQTKEDLALLAQRTGIPLHNEKECLHEGGCRGYDRPTAILNITGDLSEELGIDVLGVTWDSGLQWSIFETRSGVITEMAEGDNYACAFDDALPSPFYETIKEKFPRWVNHFSS